MKTLTLIVLIILPLSFFGQQTKKVTNKKKNEVYFVLKSDKEIRHGPYRKFGCGEQVYVAGQDTTVLTIDTNGVALNHRVTNSLGPIVDEAVLNKIKELPDDWLPAILRLGKCHSAEVVSQGERGEGRADMSRTALRVSHAGGSVVGDVC